MIPILLDYETLRVIWWLLLGLLLIGFAVTDGFDLGVGTLLPFVARTDLERRVLINTIGPVWEGNQVWFILGGGAIFAAWPPLYATAFSGFYMAMFLTLFALILRPVGFKFRSKLADPRWRLFWDWALFAGGLIPAFVFGVAIGNVIQGVPFHFTDLLLPIYTGSFIALFNPFGLLVGLTSVAMVIMHGGVYLVVKTEGNVARRAAWAATFGAGSFLWLFVLGGVAVALFIDGYVVTAGAEPDGPSNPIAKEVAVQSGVWFGAYAERPWALIAPLLGIAGAALAIMGIRQGRPGRAFIASSMAVVGAITTVGLTMFPFILPSSSAPSNSLTVWDASSSHLTLFVMLIAAVIFMPLIVAYTSWVFRVMRGKVTAGPMSKTTRNRRIRPCGISAGFWASALPVHSPS